jgi:glutamate-1-semialdehyde aminotransferase
MPRGVPMSWMDDLYEHPPMRVSHGSGSSFTDVDGNTYVDMYVARMSASLTRSLEAARTRRIGM